MELAEEALTSANGSANKHVNNKIAQMIQDADDMDIVIAPGQLANFKRIVSKCVNEYLHKEQVLEHY